ADDAPGRFVPNDAVGNKGADAHDGKETQGQGPKQEGKSTQDQSRASRPFISSDEFEPIVPGLFVTMATAAGLEPGVEGPEQVPQAAPVEKCAGIKEDDRPNSR